MSTANKKSVGASAPDSLSRFFRDPANKRLSTAEYVAQGVLQVTPASVQALVPRLAALRERITAIQDSARLQARLMLLAQYVEDTHAHPESDTAQREAVFALAYFDESSDRIPDEVPEYGLLDDALIVEAVLERNGAALRQHWRSRGRDVPETF